MIKLLTTSAMTLMLSACASTNGPGPMFQATAIGDSVTTYVGLKNGAMEQNPILDTGNAASTAAGGYLTKRVLAKVGKVSGSRRFCEATYNALVAGGAFGTANNLAVVLKEDKAAIPAGTVAFGTMYFKSRSEARTYCSRR